jgi:toxin ParE1/3/4
MPVVAIRPRALDDLSEIWAYIANDSTTSADKFVSMVDRKFRMLARDSGLGRPRPEVGENIRSFVVGRYVVFYVRLSDGVEIVRVIHGARDVEAAWQGDE